MKRPKTKPVEQVMAEEFDEWQIEDAMQATMTPHPTQPGGLPDGWTVRPSPTSTLTSSGGTNETGPPSNDVVVVERAGGGWTMVMRWLETNDRTPRTNKWSHAAATLEELYASTHPTAWKERFFETRLHDYIVAFYDPTDTDDAAEMTLVGLGARVAIFPKALKGR
jgi:hypothetical protein